MVGLGLTITCAIGAGALGLSAITLPFVLPAFRRVCIPYVPATSKQIENVIKLIDQYKNANPATKGLKIVDLGSGDGRVVLECAKAGYNNLTGVELNTVLVLYSRWKCLQQGVNGVRFLKANIFKISLKDYDVVVLFGTESIVPQVRPKLLAMKDEAGLILCRFPLPSEEKFWTLNSTEGSGIDQTWLYIRKNDY